LASLLSTLVAPAAQASPQAPLPAFAPKFLFGLGQRRPAPALVFTYEGFQIDASAARRLQPPERTVRALERQVDLVDHVGLKPDMLAAMRQDKILADLGAAGEATRFVPGEGVMVEVRRLDPAKPVLLIGLLKAYHDRHLDPVADGVIARYRTEAAHRDVWPKTALMLQSDTDYFALTGAAYLYGAITREPYSRSKLRQTQPQYTQWLAGLFDDGRMRR